MNFKVGEIYYEPRRLSLVYLESIQTDSDGYVKGNFITMRTNFKYQTLISGETRFREPVDSDYIEFLENELTRFHLHGASAHLSEDSLLLFSGDEYISLNSKQTRELLKMLQREING
jgi:hypothetical protein